MRKLYNFLVSGPLMGALFIILGAAMGIATFIENDFGTNAAKAMVYNSWWFEGAFALLAFNLVGHIFKHRMLQWSKLPVLLFHASFFIILLGAAVTRHWGYEGLMHIREGASSSHIFSTQTFVTVKTTVNGQTDSLSKEVLFSTISPFECNITTANGIKVKSNAFIPNASLQPIEDPTGMPHAILVGAAGMGRQEQIMVPGQHAIISGIELAFESADTTSADFRMVARGSMLKFVSNQPVAQMQMQSGQNDTLPANTEHTFYTGMLYSIGEARLVLKQYFPAAIMSPVYQPGIEGLPEAVVFDVRKGTENRQLSVTGRPSEIGKPTIVQIDDVTVEVSYGAVPIALPFSLHLNDFIVERYPGSHSPSSFASEVVLIDPEHGIKENRRIYMNNILNYRGYRFFQSSYDVDELGTILSVNRDPIGTGLTYIGYALLALGFVLALSMKGTRFRNLYNLTTKLAQERKALATTIAILVLLPLSAFSQKATITKEQAAAFGNLWVQDNQGRTKPLNSLNSEIARKLVKHNSFKGLSADAFVLGIMADPVRWQSEPLLTIAHPQLRELLALTEKKASFRQFFGANGAYKLGTAVETAYRKKPSSRNKFDQEVMKVDEQVNILYMLQAGKLFKLFPNPANSHAPWLTPDDFPGKGFTPNDSLFARNVLSMYVSALVQNKHDDAQSYLTGILGYQNKHAQDILPTEQHKQLEIFYNNTNIFMMAMPILIGLGLLLLVFQFTGLLANRHFVLVNNIGFWVAIALFVLYAAGLALRWHISGHAPWSNGYESMLYIGFCTLLAGLVFSKKNAIALSVSALFAGIILMVAHLSWMNPEITNLVPVLKSYWLTIHVAIIVASYGFLGLGALLAFLNLLLIGLKNTTNQRRLSLMVDELSAIAEMGMTIGLYLLTIGAFLGGVWANESWGRYWGWDPKETWSAVTIIVYAFILHMRMIPGLKSPFAFNMASVVGYGSVIMTYLGVNYYLAGMHSYAKGDPLPIPDFVYYTVATILVVGIYAWYNNRKLEKEIEK